MLTKVLTVTAAAAAGVGLASLLWVRKSIPCSKLPAPNDDDKPKPRPKLKSEPNAHGRKLFALHLLPTVLKKRIFEWVAGDDLATLLDVSPRMTRLVHAYLSTARRLSLPFHHDNKAASVLLHRVLIAAVLRYARNLRHLDANQGQQHWQLGENYIYAAAWLEGLIGNNRTTLQQVTLPLRPTLSYSHPSWITRELGGLDVLAALGTCSDLRVLDLERLTLSEEQWSMAKPQLLEIFRSCCKLNTLRLLSPPEPLSSIENDVILAALTAGLPLTDLTIGQLRSVRLLNNLASLDRHRLRSLTIGTVALSPRAFDLFVAILSKQLPELTRLERLCLSYTNLWWPPEDANPGSDTTWHLPALVHLNLSLPVINCRECRVRIVAPKIESISVFGLCSSSLLNLLEQAPKLRELILLSDWTVPRLELESIVSQHLTRFKDLLLRASGWPQMEKFDVRIRFALPAEFWRLVRWPNIRRLAISWLPSSPHSRSSTIAIRQMLVDMPLLESLVISLYCGNDYKLNGEQEDDKDKDNAYRRHVVSLEHLTDVSLEVADDHLLTTILSFPKLRELRLSGEGVHISHFERALANMPALTHLNIGVSSLVAYSPLPKRLELVSFAWSSSQTARFASVIPRLLEACPALCKLSVTGDDLISANDMVELTAIYKSQSRRPDFDLIHDSITCWRLGDLGPRSFV